MKTTAKPLTYDEWLQLPQNEGREECVDGVVETMPPTKWNHSAIVDAIFEQLHDQCDRNLVHVTTTTFGLIIREEPLTQRVPDIAVFIRAYTVLKDGYVHSAPELAVEVLSPANTPRRVREKLQDYASIRLPEVWVVDSETRAVSVHLLRDGEYNRTDFPHDGVTSPALFPSVTVDFSRILP